MPLATARRRSPCRCGRTAKLLPSVTVHASRIVAADRVLDLMRTAVNVWGDAVGAAVIAALEGAGEPRQTSP